MKYVTLFIVGFIVAISAYHYGYVKGEADIGELMDGSLTQCFTAITKIVERCK